MKKLILFLFLVVALGGIYFFVIRQKSSNGNYSKYISIDSGAGDATQSFLKADYDNKEKAIRLGNPEYCSKIEERESSYAFNQYIECVDKVALKNKDFGVCMKYYSDPYTIKRCIYNIEVELRNLTKCDEIEDHYYKAACQDYVKTFILKSQHMVSFNVNSCFACYECGCTYSIDGGKAYYKLSGTKKTQCIYNLDNGGSRKYHDLITNLIKDTHKSKFNINNDIFLEGRDYDTFLDCVKKYSE